MSANGFMPAKGVDAAQALNTYTPQITPANTACKLNWYPSRRCAVQVDTDALNGIMAQLLCTIDTAQIAYDCTDPCQLAEAARRLSVVCRSNITPAPVAWPPTAYVGDLITDDTSATPNLWYWDCNSNAYVNTVQSVTVVAEVICRSELDPIAAFPPTTNVAKVIVDDTDDVSLTVWFWDCNSGGYRPITTGCPSIPDADIVAHDIGGLGRTYVGSGECSEWFLANIDGAGPYNLEISRGGSSVTINVGDSQTIVRIVGGRAVGFNTNSVQAPTVSAAIAVVGDGDVKLAVNGRSVYASRVR